MCFAPQTAQLFWLSLAQLSPMPQSTQMLSKANCPTITLYMSIVLLMSLIYGHSQENSLCFLNRKVASIESPVNIYVCLGE